MRLCFYWFIFFFFPGVYFDCCVRQIKFVDFCGKYRLPLMHYLCSPECSSPCSSASHSSTSQSESDSEDEASVAAHRMQKVLLGWAAVGVDNAKTLSKDDSKRKWSLKLIGSLSVHLDCPCKSCSDLSIPKESSSVLRFFECNLFCMAVQNSSAGWSQFLQSLWSNTRRMVHSEEQSQSAWSGVTWGHWVD